MASLDELIEQAQQAIDQLDQAISQVGAVENGAEELQGQFASMGAEDKTEQLGAIKDGADSWRSYLQGGVDQRSQLIEQIQAAKG